MDKKCPRCGCWVMADQHIYVIRKTNEVIGCDYCLRDDYADEYWDYSEGPDEEEQLYNAADDYNDWLRCERRCGR